MTEAILVLEDGRTFHGEAFGSVGETFGEAVFATGMTGYQETLTDPSYHRQVVVQTAPHIGNTGVNDEDDESDRIWVSGYVVRDPARTPSNWRATGSLSRRLADEGVVGISGVDTRALTRHLRERGAMRVGVSSLERNPAALRERVRSSPPMLGADLSAEVTTSRPYLVPEAGGHRFTVALLDYGVKRNVARRLAARGVRVHVLPSWSSWEEVRAVGADAVFLSPGPGDPATADDAVHLVRQALRDGMPVLGICFGNQLIGRAVGLPTYKLQYGHRGLNQPVLDRSSGRVEITSHNHGFAVGWPYGDGDDPFGGAVPTDYGTVRVSHVDLNDGVVEGLRVSDANNRTTALSVQYHPEAAAGTHDADHLFDRFVELLEGAAPAADTGERDRAQA